MEKSETEALFFDIPVLGFAAYSGIGKTALVREIYKPITRQRGYFISGKFDQIHRRLAHDAHAAPPNQCW